MVELNNKAPAEVKRLFRDVQSTLKELAKSINFQESQKKSLLIRSRKQIWEKKCLTKTKMKEKEKLEKEKRFERQNYEIIRKRLKEKKESLKRLQLGGGEVSRHPHDYVDPRSPVDQFFTPVTSPQRDEDAAAAWITPDNSPTAGRRFLEMKTPAVWYKEAAFSPQMSDHGKRAERGDVLSPVMRDLELLGNMIDYSYLLRPSVQNHCKFRLFYSPQK